MLRRILMVIFLAGILLGVGIPAQAEGEVPIEPTKVDYTMGGAINLETRVLADIPVQEAWVSVNLEGDVSTILGSALLHPSNVLTYELELSIIPSRHFLKSSFGTLSRWKMAPRSPRIPKLSCISTTVLIGKPWVDCLLRFSGTKAI